MAGSTAASLACLAVLLVTLVAPTRVAGAAPVYWSVTQSPIPDSGRFNGVSCVSNSPFCMAVGYVQNSSTNSAAGTDTFVEVRKGTTWSVIASPKP